ncbi:MAG: SH3 domain-containing protein [Oscillospiraceae bacterium]|nr:SH3 domain-containing protein [Oscillospiraceae bacterium]
MKRLFFILSLLLIIPCSAFAKSYVFDDGVYTVGVDLPEGHYVVSSHKSNVGFCAVQVFDDPNMNEEIDSGEILLFFTVWHPNNAYYKPDQGLTEYLVGLKNGMCIDVMDKAIFTPDNATTLSPIDFQDSLRSLSLSDLKVVEQELLVAKLTAQSKAEAASKPKSTPEPSYVSLNYERAARLPEVCMNQRVRFSGKVLQVMGSRADGYHVRLATKGDYDDVVYLYIDSDHAPSINLLEGDKLTIKGVLKGDYTYQSVFGQAITLPSAYAESVSISLSEERKTTIGYSDGSSDTYINGVLVEESSDTAVVTKGVNIRSEASANSEKVGTAKPGDKLLVTQANYVKGWHQILYNGDIAYVSSKYVKLK